MHPQIAGPADYISSEVKFFADDSQYEKGLDFFKVWTVLFYFTKSRPESLSLSSPYIPPHTIINISKAWRELYNAIFLDIQ